MQGTPQDTRQLDWTNIAFLTLTPLIGLVGGIFYALHYGVPPRLIGLCAFLFLLTGLSITGGYHRHFAHASYRAHPLIRLFYLVFGACALENSAIRWAADHRMHHRYTDTDKDPYNAGKGFWSSHIGWIFYKAPDKEEGFALVRDLLEDPAVYWQHNHYLSIGLIIGLGLPLAIGFMWGCPLGALLWGGVIRIVLVHHATFFINSLAHMVGKQPYSKSDSSKDSWWLAFLTNGEGFHNFHHAFPSDYRNGIYWYQWDPTKWLIAGLATCGMTDKLHRVPVQLILRARLEIEALNAENRLQAFPPEMAPRWRAQMQAARHAFEHTLTQWAEAKVKYRELKIAARHGSETVAAQWKTKLKEYEAGLDEAREQWRDFLRGLDATAA